MHAFQHFFKPHTPASVARESVDRPTVQFPINRGPYQICPSARAILRLTLGSSVAVATALAIPDAFAILPGAPDIATWLVRITGLWCSAYILWACGFLAILHIARIFSGAIEVDEEGLKLWRFGKKISWKNVLSSTITARKNFSRLLLISPCALELTLYLKKDKGKGITAKKIPSFQYDPVEFASLIYFIGKFAFAIEPSSVNLYMMQPEESSRLSAGMQEGRVKRLILSSIISTSLILFLARSAATNYTFNVGNRYFARSDYQNAIQYYCMASAINPFFPPAWDRLARSQLRTGDPEAAMESWKRALQVKPDFVESKLGLSQIYMRRFQLEAAEQLIFSCLRLAPKDEATFLNLARLNALKGNHREAIRIQRQLLNQPRGRDNALYGLVQSHIAIGEYEVAERLLEEDKAVAGYRDPTAVPFRRLVEAELALHRGDLDKADRIFAELYKGDKHVDLLLDIALLRIQQNRPAEAEKMLKQMEQKQESGKASPWIAYCRAAIAFKRGDSMQGQWMVEQAAKSPYPDPCLLARCAMLLVDNGFTSRAEQLLDRSRALDDSNCLVNIALQKLRMQKQ